MVHIREEPELLGKVMIALVKERTEPDSSRRPRNDEGKSRCLQLAESTLCGLCEMRPIWSGDVVNHEC